MPKWIEIGPQNEFPAGGRQRVRPGGVPVVVFNIEGRLTAVLDVCPHAGLPLGEGELRGTVLTCPFHGYAFNVETGHNADFPSPEPALQTFPVRVGQSGKVEIDIQPIKEERDGTQAKTEPAGPAR